MNTETVPDVVESVVEVIDKLSRNPEKPRYHELPRADGYDGYDRVAFPAYQRVKLKMHQARILIGNPGFEVLQDGVPLRPVTEHNDKGDSIVLAHDQVIASFDELTVDALVRRAQKYQGGERMNPKLGKKEVISFLMEKRAEEDESYKPTVAPRLSDIRPDGAFQTGQFDAGGLKLEMDDPYA